jgi:nicotinamidase-related amidase
MAGTTTLVVLLVVGLIIGAGIGYAAVSVQGVHTSTITSSVTTSKTTTVTTNYTVPLPALQTLVLNHSTTALLVLDFTSGICYKYTMCNASLTTVASLESKARAAGLLVIHTRIQVPPVANVSGEIVILNDSGADKFLNTALQYYLQKAGITTLVITGVATNGAVLYTSFEANVRGYTVVVPEDCVSSASSYIQSFSFYQLLNQPGHSNPTNAALASKAVTLSNSSLITFK